MLRPLNAIEQHPQPLSRVDAEMCVHFGHTLRFAARSCAVDGHRKAGHLTQRPSERGWACRDGAIGVRAF